MIRRMLNRIVVRNFRGRREFCWVEVGGGDKEWEKVDKNTMEIGKKQQFPLTVTQGWDREKKGSLSLELELE